MDVIAEQLPKVSVIAPSVRITQTHCKEIELQGYVEIPMELSEDQFLDQFLTFFEVNRWSFGGGVRTIVDGCYLNEDGTPGEQVWPEKERSHAGTSFLGKFQKVGSPS